MSKRVGAFAVAATLTVGLVGGCDRGDELPLATRSVSRCAPVGESAEQHFRRNMGLDASDEAIGRAAAASHGFDRYGVPLTAAELREMDRRQKISSATNPLRQLVHDHPDEYGHLWIDQLNGGITVVQIAPKGDKAKVEAVMARRKINPQWVRFERVRRPMAELQAIKDDFMRDEAPKLRARGLAIQSAGPDLPNEVRVHIVDLSPRVRHQLENTYPRIRFRENCVGSSTR